MVGTELEVEGQDVRPRVLAVPAKRRLLVLPLGSLGLLEASLRFRLGLPSSHCFTWLAKRREHSDSKNESSVGLKFTTMSVLPSPDRAG